jgi:D-3-phosphoglycerate dehydrogenase
MFRILATDGIAKSAAAKLETLGYEVVQEFYEPDELAEKVKEFDALVVRSATKVRVPVIDAAAEAGRLKVIIRGGVGVDNIDVDYARSKGILVENTPNASSASVAELAIAHMFSLARYVGIANVTMRDGKWEKKAYKGVELSGKTLGLVGIGRIAKETARRASALGMHVIYTNRSGHCPENEPYQRVEMDELLAKSDFVSLHMPASKGQAPLIDAAAFAKMKEGAFLINTARGALVDEAALCDALESGRLAGAGLDVYQEEPCKNERLLGNPKVSLTPHIGGSTKEAQDRIGEEIVQHILNILK